MEKGGCVSRTCGTCMRSWDGRATFCGACGDLLDDALASARAPVDAGRRGRRAVVGLAVVLGLVLVAAAVPSMTIDRVPPVDGEIGVPDSEQLQAAPADTVVRRSVAPPPVTCQRGDVEVDCVAWSRALAPRPSPTDDHGVWVLVEGDRVVVAAGERVEAADATTGTRLWHLDLPGDAGTGTTPYPAGVSDDALVLVGPERTTLVELEDGTERWSVATDSAVWGMMADDGVVLTGGARTPDGTRVVARHPADGRVLWEWVAPWFDLYALRALGGDRLVVVSGSGDGLAVLDTASGRELTRSDRLSTSDWVLGVTDEVAVVMAAREGSGPAGPDPAGDPGGTVRAIDLADGTQRWEHEVRATEVNLQMVDGLVVAPSTGRLTALDAHTGELAWEVATDGSEHLASHGDMWSLRGTSPAAAAQVVVAIEQTRSLVRGRDPATGELRWEVAVDGGLQHASVDGDRLLVFAGDGYRLLDATTGREQVRIHARTGSIVADDPFVLHHHDLGYVTRLDLEG